MRALPIVCIVALIGCSTASDVPEETSPPPREAPRRTISDFGPLLLEMVPDDSWWRDPRFAEPLNLTNEQFQALDRIFDEQSSEIERLQRDLRVAMRDYRNAFLVEPAVQADLAAAARRVRGIRDAIFDRQSQMLGAERLVLTRSQWAKVLDEMEQRRRDRGNWDERRPGRGPRGYPRGGRGRPWPY